MANIDEKKPPVPGDEPDKRNADSAFDDLNIEVDESELESELRDQPPGRKT